MSTTLTPCSSCARHVRRTEHACPFCGAALALGSAPSPRVVSERLGRAAIFSLGAAAITSVAGCALAHERVPAPIAEHDSGTFVGAYGAPALEDASPRDAGAPMTHYGAPPPAEDAGTDADLGCCSADYGAPPSP